MIPTDRRSGPNRDEAEALALSALAFLAEDGARLGRFLGETGIEPQALARRASAPDTLVAVLDYLLGDEPLLLVFSATTGHQPDQIAIARDLLGADDVRGPQRT